MGKRTKHIKPNDKSKPWFKREHSNRPERNIDIKNIFLIYCEGENTEPEYFKSFPVTTETKVEAIGLGRSKTALVREVIKRLSDVEKDEDRQVWVVFDRDLQYFDKAQGDNDFNEAITLAKTHDINCAYSNDCFEVWFLLHYDYLESSLHRSQIYSKLSDKLGLNYENDGKGKTFAKGLYLMFLDKLTSAIRNARRLHDFHEGKEYCHQNPCTTIYLLVEALNQNLRK